MSYLEPVKTKSTNMFAKVKTATFIDTLRFELVASSQNPLKAVLRDDKGSVCSVFETTFVKEEPVITWKGLNDLPYGVYTLELSQGEEEIRLKLVKRV
jgi:hypothetical protein